MRLDSIELRDFRGISNLTLPLDERLTMIVGANGTGKTSILNAMSLSLSGLCSLWPDEQGNPKILLASPKKSDVALGKSDFSVTTSLSTGAAADGNRSVTLQLCANHTRNHREIDRLINLTQRDSQWFSVDEPLFVLYPQNRVFASPESPQEQGSISTEQLRKESLSSNLQAIQALSSWWDRLDAQEARRHRDEEHGYRDPQLEAVRKLVGEMEEFEGIGYEAKAGLPGLYLRKTGGPMLHVDQLSSGERAYLILLADLARRLQVVKPDARLAEIAGVVLIDEIELNLHPTWQRLIVPTLVRVFASCQFIVTTHSPQVLGEIEVGRVMALHRNSEGEVEAREIETTFGRDSNDLLIDVLDSTERDRDVKRSLEELEELISNNELSEARRIMEKLRVELRRRPVELEIAEQRIRRRERGRGG